VSDGTRFEFVPPPEDYCPHLLDVARRMIVSVGWKSLVGSWSARLFGRAIYRGPVALDPMWVVDRGAGSVAWCGEWSKNGVSFVRQFADAGA
jgi:hypothetical protein